MKKNLLLGTRGSALALAQSNEVAEALRAAHPGLEVSLEIIRTTGDKRLDLSLIDAPGLQLDKGLFTKELETALLEKKIDIAVHSLKDLPTEMPAGLELGAILEREDTRDAVLFRVGESLASLPEGAIVGTSSVRRRVQIQERYPALVLKEIRGNVPTRIEKLIAGEYDAIVLAAAGLIRLGYAPERQITHQTSTLPVEWLDWMLPAPGQGAIAVQMRQGDKRVASLLKPLHHIPTAIAVEAERILLRSMGGGCQVALGAKADLEAKVLTLQAVWFATGSLSPVRTQQVGSEAEEIAARAAVALISGN